MCRHIDEFEFQSFHSYGMDAVLDTLVQSHMQAVRYEQEVCYIIIIVIKIDVMNVIPLRYRNAVSFGIHLSVINLCHNLSDSD